MNKSLSASRSANLCRRIVRTLSESDLRVPNSSESEPAFTRAVLAPVVHEEISRLVDLPLQFRGDGGSELALPASALSIDFFPDLAVSAGTQNLWAAEVKILRSRGRQNAIATALGQGTLYRSRYEHVAVVLIDTAPASRESQRRLIEDVRHLGLTLIIRPKLGKSLLKQFNELTN